MKLAAVVALLPLLAPQEPAKEVTLEFVQTTPTGTELGLPSLREADEVWIEMIDGAEESIELAHFYASNQAGSRLEPVVQALERAVDRGVEVRFLAEKKFYETYPDTLDRLGDAVRLYDVAAVMGGVLHAKYMVVDRREAFLGSQNFDWRALEHIQELGVRVRGAKVVAPLHNLFRLDWEEAGPETVATWSESSAVSGPGETSDGGLVTVVYSPKDYLPFRDRWDLPRLVEQIDGAKESIRVQLLSYKTVDYDGAYWDGLETPLRRAAARGVKVELMLSHWATSEGSIEGLQSLQSLPNVEVKILTVPPDPGGFIPYGRVAHAKYMVVDGARGWIGTSNWSRDYFYASRNVGLMLEGEAFAATLEAYFRVGWTSDHAETVVPGKDYPAPRVGR